MHTAHDTRSIDETLPTGVQDVLAAYLAAKRAGLTAMEPSVGVAVDALTEFVLGGGKRLRPTFAWWGWRGAGGPADGPRAEAGADRDQCLELMQACALVHDDLMDCLRRCGAASRPCTGRSPPGTGRRAGTATPTFGAAAAILIGDLALAWADDLFTERACRRRAGSGRRRWRACAPRCWPGSTWTCSPQADGGAEVARRGRAAGGAAEDRQPTPWNGRCTSARRWPVRTAELVAALRAFGGDIGVAFQLRDDLLGVFGDPRRPASRRATTCARASGRC